MMNFGEYMRMEQLLVFYSNDPTANTIQLVQSKSFFSVCPFTHLRVSECRAAVFVEGADGGALLPAEVWLPGVPLDCVRDQQTGAGPEGQWGRPGWGWTGRVRPEGVQGGRIFQRM